MIIQNHEELRKWIECAQMAGHLDPNEFLRHFENRKEFGFSFIDFYGWTVVTKDPYLNSFHVDAVTQPVSGKAVMICDNKETYLHDYTKPQIHCRAYLSLNLVKWLECHFEAE